jgi:micrococcal nuclease
MLRRLLTTIAFVAAVAALPAHAQERIPITIVDVLEGDLVRAADINGRVEQIHLAGIDAPELGHPRLGAQCWARESLLRTRELLPPGLAATFELEETQRDIDGRLLGYIYVGDRNVSQILATEGHAIYADIPPSARYGLTLIAASETAARLKLGMWGACVAQPPTPILPAASPDAGSITPIGPGECPEELPIKGNRSTPTLWIYHLPTGASYERTWAEECFATEDDARRAGYRASQR